MAKIEDLVLTVSRNTNNQVAIKVSYTIHFSDTERSKGILFSETVKLSEREGFRDDDPARYVVTPAGPNPPDRAVTLWYSVEIGAEDPAVASPPGPPKGVEKLTRSWEKTLTPDELTKFRDPGREHPYVTVILQPNGIAGDSKIAELAIDIGDPNE